MVSFYLRPFPFTFSSLFTTAPIHYFRSRLTTHPTNAPMKNQYRPPMQRIFKQTSPVVFAEASASAHIKIKPQGKSTTKQSEGKNE
jgi:hypothetical protein